MLKDFSKKIGLGELKNFINVRISTSNHTKEINDIKHNLRKNNSLSVPEKPGIKNFHYVKNENGKYKRFADGEGYDYISKSLRQHRKEHNNLFYEKNKRKLRDRNSTFLNGVFTFSEKMEKEFKKDSFDNELFIKDTVKTIKKLEKQLETECLTFSIHRDEKNIHVQFTMKNFDSQGNSIFYKHRTNEKLSVLQDIGFEGFNQNWGVNRGIKKEKPDKNVGLKQHYEKEKAKIVSEYNEVIMELQKDNKKLISKQKELRKEIQTLELTVNERKKIYEKIDHSQKEIRILNKQLKELEKGSYQDNLELTNLTNKRNDLVNKNNALITQLEPLIKERDSYKEKYEELSRKWNNYEELEKRKKELQDNAREDINKIAEENDRRRENDRRNQERREIKSKSKDFMDR